MHVFQDVIHEVDGCVEFAFGAVRHELDVAIVWIFALTGAFGFDTGNTVHQFNEVDYTFIDLNRFARIQFQHDRWVTEGYVTIFCCFTRLAVVRAHT